MGEAIKLECRYHSHIYKGSDYSSDWKDHLHRELQALLSQGKSERLPIYDIFERQIFGLIWFTMKVLYKR